MSYFTPELEAFILASIFTPDLEALTSLLNFAADLQKYMCDLASLDHNNSNYVMLLIGTKLRVIFFARHFVKNGMTADRKPKIA